MSSGNPAGPAGLSSSAPDSQGVNFDFGLSSWFADPDRFEDRCDEDPDVQEENILWDEPCSFFGFFLDFWTGAECQAPKAPRGAEVVFKRLSEDERRLLTSRMPLSGELCWSLRRSASFRPTRPGRCAGASQIAFRALGW